MFNTLLLISNGVTRFFDDPPAADVVTKITTTCNNFLQLLQSIVTPVAGIAIACLGLYLIFFGSEQRAWDTAKKWTLTIVIGVVVLYSAMPIINFIVSVAK